MPLWGSVDNAANSDIAVLPQLNRPTTAAGQTYLYANTTANAYFQDMTVGQYGVSVGEVQADPTGHGMHSGWVLRKVGSGLRAGRVTTEVLVAMGSLSGDAAAAEDLIYPDYKLSFSRQPSSNTARWGVPVQFTAIGASVPTGASLTYKWEVNDGTGWAVVNNGGVYANTTGTVLNISNNALLTTKIYRNNVKATGAYSVYSSNAVLTVTPYTLGFATQPAANSMGAGNAVVFFVVANSVPAGAAIAYQWEKNYGTGWSTVTEAGVFSGVTSNTLTISDNTDLTDNIFRVQVNAPGAAATANSANALLTVL